METARFALPLLQPGQAQKEMWHNEALARIDALIQPVVKAVALDAPPGSPVAGEAWIVGNTPAGAWTGKADMLATWTAGGWRFAAPVEGMRAHLAGEGVSAHYQDGAWTVGNIRGARLVVDGVTVVKEQQPAIAGPAGGTIVDTEARAALEAVLAALRSHGLVAA